MELIAGGSTFRIRGVNYRSHDAVQTFFDYYASNPLLVELNLETDLK